MKKVVNLFTLLAFLGASFFALFSYAQMENSEDKSAILLSGQQFNSVIKTLANGGVEVPYTGTDNNIQSFQRVNEIPEGVITGEISVADSEYPVYAWFTGGIIYYVSEAGVIHMNSDSSNMFYNMQGLTSLDLSNWDTSKVYV